MKKLLNIGIVAHVDAGKTSLTERLYSQTHEHYQGGSIKKANTITDTLELEKERGITIKSASVSLEWQETKINVIDMPGHVEFFGEVVRALDVIDLAILVVSSLGSLPTQTRRIFDTLQEAGIPTLFFINKTDLATANTESICLEIEQKLTSQLVSLPMTSAARDKIIETDDVLLEQYLLEENVSEMQVKTSLTESVVQRKLFPIIYGSAVTGQGVTILLDYLAQFEYAKVTSEETSAYLYKIMFVDGQKQAFFKLISGKIHRYETYALNETDSLKLNRFFVLEDNQFVLSDTVEAGDIFMLTHEEQLRIGDTLGESYQPKIDLPEPTLRIIFSSSEDERMLLLDALKKLTIEDPLLDFQIDSRTSEVSVAIFGRVQKEYLEDTLRREYDFKTLAVSLPKIVYKEMVTTQGIGSIRVDDDVNSYWATMTLKVEPQIKNSSIFESLVPLGYLKRSFQNAIETSVLDALEAGLYDYEIINAKVTLTDAEFYSPVSTPSEFRKLTPYAFYKALLEAKTKIVEPIMALSLTCLSKDMGTAISELGKREATIGQVEELFGETTIEALMTQSNYLSFEENLDELFNGQGYVKGRVVAYQPVTGDKLYQQGSVDQTKALIIKEQKRGNF